MTVSQSHRYDSGGHLDRARTLTFTVDAKEYTGYAGDTVASALLASGQVRVGNSIYRDRPRGVLTAGVEEPNAFVRVHGDHNECMMPATALELVDGMQLTFEDGIGELDHRPDSKEYDRMHFHTDIAIVGGGPAGLAAAREATAAGSRVVLFEQDFALGGSLLTDPTQQIEGILASDWIDQVRAQLEAAPECTVLTRTSVFGSYDNNYLLAVEKRTDHLSAAEIRDGMSRQRLWHVTAKRVVLATGAFERSIVFADNDVPGVMLASAAQAYVRRWACRLSERAVVFTTNNSAYDAALALHDIGAHVTIVDARSADQAGGAVVDRVRGLEGDRLDLEYGCGVVGVDSTDDRVSGVWIAAIDDAGALTEEARRVDADLVAVSGGWTPNVSLHSQRQGPMGWDEELAGFIATRPARHQRLAGALMGTYWTDGCVEQGILAGRDAARGAADQAMSGQADTTAADKLLDEQRVSHAGHTRTLWIVEGRDGGYDTHFIDPQRDNTAGDVVRSTGAGMRSVEHVKRYTSISTGLDQGKIGGVNTIGLLTRLLSGEDTVAIPTGQPGQEDMTTVDGQPLHGTETGELTEGGRAVPAPTPRTPTPGIIGTTTFRAPYTPVAFVALAGRARGEMYDPARLSSIHTWHVAHGALFEDVGQWKRPWYYPKDGEDMDAAVARECRAAREGVAYMDATTLGKIEIRGADTGEFLNRVYTNGFKKLKVGKGRYGVMCKPDGMVFDDGVTLRLEENRYFMTTTTGGAAAVLDWLEEWSQTEWPDLDVVFTSATEQWATIAVVGPKSRDVIATMAPDLDVSKEGFEFMGFRHTTLASGIPARLCRITFSGELAFEINVPTWYGLKVWEDVTAAGAEYGITPYGTETMHVLRAEKSYPIVGQDTDGTVTPQDLGMDWIVSKLKDFIGKRSHAREGHVEEGRKQLVAVLPTDHSVRLPEGTQIIETDARGDYTGEGLPTNRIPMLGHVTSSYHSQALGRSFGMALIRDGRQRVGSTLLASFQGQFIEVEVADAVLYDKEGAKRDG